MPKAVSSFYNHSTRATTSRTFSISAAPGGRRSVVTSSAQNIVPLDSGSENVNEGWFPMDIDDSADNDAPMEGSNSPLDPSITVAEMPGIKILPRHKAKRYQNSDAPLKTWENHREEYLAECMALEGRGGYGSRCAGCIESFPRYRCRDCTHGPMWCQSCLVKRHAHNPLHTVQMWNGLFFQRSTLQYLGLRVQLGHAPGRFCPKAEHANKDFVVIHTNGIHQVDIDYCRCTDVPRHLQLLRVAWWPGTPIHPKTCVTMTALQQYHILNLQGKITGFSYYRGLEYLTDNSCLNKPPDRLPSFMLIVREYRHTKMLKHGGRAFDPDPNRVLATAPGSLAMPCRACPLPNINLPTGWQNVPPERAWLYMLTVAMDANFRLRSKLRGAITKDPTMGLGWSYFVNNAPYADFIKDYIDQEEIGSCVGFQALLNMLTKKSRGLRATGLAAVSCARHQLFRALGLGDLQKGERQCNMDYLFTSSVKDANVKRLTVSYDVSCQWYTNFWKRNAGLPEHVRMAFHPAGIRALVPKFHLQSHVDDCHSAFSFNYSEGGARTDGEGVERNWDDLNPQAPSTAEMTPGHRWETLDVCCGWVNYRKTMGLGNLLLKRMLLAIPQAIQSRSDFVNFDECLRVDIPEEVDEMERALKAWEEDRSQGDPYRVPKSNITLAEVRLLLAEEEKKRVEDGLSSVQEVGASALLITGLDIQIAQETLRVEVKGLRKQTVLQSTTLVERRTALLKRVQRFRDVQALHMPTFDPKNYTPHRGATVAGPSASGVTTSLNVEDFTLWLPSDLGVDDRRKYCSPGLAEVEERIRFAEATDALETLRHHLRTRSFTNKFKVANMTGQIHNTRARERQHIIDDRVHAAERQYRRARAALFVLRGGGDWEDMLQVLEPSDVRALNERELTQQEKDDIIRVRTRGGGSLEALDEERAIVAPAVVGEGLRRPSWIWFTGSNHEDMKDPRTKAALGVEWAKAKARAHRWEEEVVLLDEEMRRILVYCTWKAKWWRTESVRRVPELQDNDPCLTEGLAAYGERQAALEDSIFTKWTVKWKGIRDRAHPIILRVLGKEWDAANPAGILEPEIIEIEIDNDRDDDDNEDDGFD